MSLNNPFNILYESYSNRRNSAEISVLFDEKNKKEKISIELEDIQYPPTRPIGSFLIDFLTIDFSKELLNENLNEENSKLINLFLNCKDDALTSKIRSASIATQENI